MRRGKSSFQISCMLEDSGNMSNTGTPGMGLIVVLIQPKSLVSKGKDMHRLPLEKEDTQQQGNKMFKLNIIGYITPSLYSCQSRLRKTFSTPKVLVSNVYFIQDFFWGGEMEKRVVFLSSQHTYSSPHQTSWLSSLPAANDQVSFFLTFSPHSL